MVVRQRGLLLLSALELELELEDGLAAAAAAVWSSSAGLQWPGQCGRLCHVLVSCFWAHVLNFFVVLPAAAPGAGALLAMVACLLGQLITPRLVAQQAHVLLLAAHSRFMPCTCCMLLSNLVCCRWFAALEKEVAP